MENEPKKSASTKQPGTEPKQPTSAEKPVNDPKEPTIKEQLEKEMASWQSNIDEAKLQLHLGSKEAQEKMQLYVDKLEKELAEAKVQWDEFDGATEKAWQNIQQGLKSSFSTMTEAFNKAKEHYK